MLTIGAMSGERTILGWAGFAALVIAIIVAAIIIVIRDSND
jgi:hypothetical protein